METTVDIIYVNFNTSSQILDSLATLDAACGKYAYRVTVVDNNSQNDDMLDQLKSTHELNYIQLESNFGFGYANNRGYESTSAPVVLFLNPDTLCVEGSIESMVSFLLGHEGVGCVGAALYDANNKPTHSFRRLDWGIRVELSNALGGIPMRLVYGKNVDHNFSGEELDVPYVCGAALMSRREILDETGVFNEKFFMYYEDNELCRRIRLKGWRVVSLPNAKIVHLEGKSIILKETRERMQDESRRTFYELTGKAWYRPFVDAVNVVLLTLGEICCSLTGKTEKKKVYSFRKKLLLGG